MRFPFLGGFLPRTSSPRAAAHAPDARHARTNNGLAVAPIGIAFATLDGRWLQFNDAFRTLLGYTREELLRISFDSITHPDDAKRELALIKRLLAGDAGSYRIEKRVMSKRGQYDTIHVRGSLARTQAGEPDFFVFIADTPQQHTVSGDDSDRFSASILAEATEIAVVRTDPRGQITGWNAGAQKLFGYRRDEVVGKNRRVLYRDNDSWADRPEAHLQAAASDRRLEMEDWRVTRDGAHLWVKCALAAYAPDGVVKGFVEIIAAPADPPQRFDMTQIVDQTRRELQDERRRRETAERNAEELRNAKDAARAEISTLTAALREEMARRKEIEKELEEANFALAERAAAEILRTPPADVIDVTPEPAVPAIADESYEWRVLEGARLFDCLLGFASEKRNGIFIASDGTRERAIFFDDGVVLSSASDDPAMLLGERLVAAGIVDERQLDRARQVMEETHLALGRVLLLMEAVSERKLLAALRRKAEDEVTAIASWPSMQWTFVDGKLPAGKLVPVDLTVTNLHRRCQRRAAEAKRLEAPKRSSSGSVPARPRRTSEHKTRSRRSTG